MEGAVSRRQKKVREQRKEKQEKKPNFPII